MLLLSSGCYFPCLVYRYVLSEKCPTQIERVAISWRKKPTECPFHFTGSYGKKSVSLWGLWEWDAGKPEKKVYFCVSKFQVLRWLTSIWKRDMPIGQMTSAFGRSFHLVSCFTRKMIPKISTDAAFLSTKNIERNHSWNNRNNNRTCIEGIPGNIAWFNAPSFFRSLADDETKVCNVMTAQLPHKS